MDNINNQYIVNSSESTSSYLSCASNEEVEISSEEYTKIQTSNQKSYVRNLYSDDDITYKENVRKLRSSKNIHQSVSTATLCVVLQKKFKNQRQASGRFSEQLPPTNCSIKTSFNQPHRKDKFLIRSNEEYTSSAVKVSSQTVQTSFTKCTTLWKSSHPKTGRQVQAKDRSITCQNQEDQCVDISLKFNTIVKADTFSEKEKSEFLREWQVNNLLNQIKGKERHPNNATTSRNKYQKESKSFMNNAMNEEYNGSKIDYKQMQQCLRNSSSALKKFEILQSLLLKLTNQEPFERHTTVQAIIDNDLFGIKSSCGNEAILKNLLWPLNVRTPHPLQTSTAKLLNTLVSYQIGREYFNHISMINLLTWSNSEHMYESMADNLMAVMMKISLNEFQRCDMLNNGLLQWLINHMEEVEFSASTFHLECMTDLLRMLMDVECSTEFSFVKIPRLIIVLVRYLNVQNEYAKINVCHALRAAFQNRIVIEMGNKIHLHGIIKDHIKNTNNSKLKEDLKFIYKLLIEYRMSKSNPLESSSVDNQAYRNDNYQRMHITQSENLRKHKRSSEKNSKINVKNLMQIKECNVDPCENDQRDVGKTESEENMQYSETVDRPTDLNSYILKLCLDKELMGTKSFDSTRVTNAVQNFEMEDLTTDDSTSIESGSATSIHGCCTEYKGNKQSVNNDMNTDIIFSNLNWELNKNSSLLNRNSQSLSGEMKEKITTKLKKKGINKGVTADMEDKNKIAATNSQFQSQTPKPNNEKSEIEFCDLSSIAKDPEARNEILENDSFIDELCEKVFDKLRTKIFCGPNCNTTCNAKCDDVQTDKEKVEHKSQET